MDVDALYYCITQALEDKSVQLVEIHGLKHIFSLTPNKIEYVTTGQGAVWITKTVKQSFAGTPAITQLAINPDQVVYVKIFKGLE